MIRATSLFLLSIFVQFVSADAALSESAAETRPLDQQVQWLRLLHYHPAAWGGSYSEARTEKFFLSRDGYRNPKAELDSLQSALTELNFDLPTGERDEHPRCRFPARSRWLASQTRLKLPPDEWCPKFSDWKNKIRARSVTFVFSSYYINNPASTYGHTLLRLNRQELSDLGRDSEGRQLLDFGANYGVTPTTTNPVLYPIFSIAGLFPGNFLVLPYFYKVREYNDYESRDLWEYDLRLTPEEVERLTEHLWELGHTVFAYHYLTDNCGFQILSLLESAAPRLDLTSALRTWVIPSDTAKVIVKKSLVERMHYRPSIRTQFEWRRTHLKSETEKSALATLEKRPLDQETLAGLSPEAQARVLDAVIDLVDLNHPREILIEDSPIKKVKNELLVRRSRLPIAEAMVIPAPEDWSPSTGHGSGRIRLGHYWDRAGRGLDFEYRGALHENDEEPNGYPEHAGIEMGYLRLRQDLAARELRLEQFTFMGIESLSPWVDFNKKPAWRLKFGLRRDDDVLCANCLRAEVAGGYGISFALGSRAVLYGLLGGDGQSSSAFQGSKAALGVGPVAGILLRPGGRVSFRSEARHFFFWHEDVVSAWPEWQNLVRYQAGPDWALEASGLFSNRKSEFGISLARYF